VSTAPASELAWRELTLGAVVAETGGVIQTGPFGSQLHASDYVPVGMPLVMPVNLGDNTIIEQGIARVGSDDVRRLRRHALREGDIVFSRRGDVGRRSIVSAHEAGWLCGTGCLAARFGRNRQTVNPEFIAIYLGSTPIRRWLEDNAVGGTMPNLNTSILAAAPVHLPPRPEQDRIVQAIKDIDGLIAGIERVTAKKELTKQGLMQQLLTGETRLKGFAGDWKKVRLGEIAHIKTGSRNNQDKAPLGRYPFYVRSATVERIDTYSYDCEAILVPGEGGIGSIFHYVRGKFEVHQRVYKISDFQRSAVGKFVYYYMRQCFGRHAMENSVKATVDSLRTWMSNTRLPPY
jgi:type I restriction enzyme S subunit